MNTLVHAAPVDKEEALHHRILDACQTIRNYPGIFQLLRESMMRRFECTLNLMEDTLGNYYSCILSDTAHKLHFF
jgi:hypothetical protein